MSAETSRRIACDCSILSIKEAANGEPLSIGRKTRSIPPALHRALRFRDKGCRFPGCTNDRFVDGHHIRHWADGGETSLDNLVLLCRRHHHLVHEGGFACEKSKDGEIIFRDQRREPLPTWSTLPTIDDVDLKAWMDREFFEHDINSDTPAAQWYAGDRMDWDLAVGSLFN
ncbi:MAG: HNH endonuclease [Proteobacteria bacterium]|nr:HNH endonuclease [Pseudomonadota bacterium]